MRHAPHQGLDYQGRHPEAAAQPDDSSDNPGADHDALACFAGIMQATVWMLAVWAVCAVAMVAALWQ